MPLPIQAAQPRFKGACASWLNQLADQVDGKIRKDWPTSVHLWPNFRAALRRTHWESSKNPGRKRCAEFIQAHSRPHDAAVTGNWSIAVDSDRTSMLSFGPARGSKIRGTLG